MAKIQRLPKDVVNRMAAGEVLARPFNAIKELVENSLDAGSTEIQVHMQNAGLKLLQVSDNGKGIDREDFELVCERFATSKLCEFEDLMHMQTYGFRGEALASLSHVAKVNIVSKRKEAKCAFQADYLDGKMVGNSKPSAGKNGTCITATDLFYNMPTRKKQMEKSGEESKMVYDTILRFAIHRPDVSFALRQSLNNDFRTKGDGNHRDVVSTLLGRDIADSLIPLSLESSRLKFEFSGHFSKPIAAATAKTAMDRKTSRSFFSVFINDRSVRCDILKRPIDDVLQSRSLICQFCSFHLKIDETRIDVNVHPTKNSVIFLEKEEIVEEIRQFFQRKLDEVLGVEETDEPSTSEENQEQTKLENFSFFTQPIKSIEAIRKPPTSSSSSERAQFSSGNKFENREKKRVDYMEVRTDAKERTLDEFIVRCPDTLESRKRKRMERIENADIAEVKDHDHHHHEDEDEEDPEDQEDQEENAGGGGEFADVSMISLASTLDGTLNQSQELEEGGLLETATVHRDFHFDSLESLRHSVVSNSSHSLRELFKTCSFVGSVDPQNVLVQFGTSLYRIDFSAVLKEFFYQISLFSFGNYGSYKLDEEPPAIRELLELLGELAQRDENYKAFEMFGEPQKRVEAEEMLAEHIGMLHDYFAIKLEWIYEEDGSKKLQLSEIPSLVHYYVPQLEKLPFLIAALVIDVDFEDEKSCFESIGRAIADLFSLDAGFLTAEQRVSAFSAMKWKAMVKQVLFPLVKRKFIPPDSFREQQIVQQLADAHDLYKVFERC